MQYQNNNGTLKVKYLNDFILEADMIHELSFIFKVIMTVKNWLEKNQLEENLVVCREFWGTTSEAFYHLLSY